MADAGLVSATVKRGLPFALVIATSAWISLSKVAIGNWPASMAPGDYPLDAEHAVNALAHGHVSTFLAAHPVMGPFSILLRAPFAALASSQLAAYQWGALPCVLAAGLLGLYLARLAQRRGSPPIAQVALVAICLVNPLTIVALQSGHPEELLTAALAVGAVAVASEGHSRRAALLLGLALASKQWAVIAIFPVLMALPRDRFRVALGAAGVAFVLMLPGFLAHPGTFAASQSNVAANHSFMDAWSAWYPFAGSVPGVVPGGPNGVTEYPLHGGSALIGAYAHSLIVLTALVAPLALALRRRRFGLSGSDAMGLLVLLALLRCALDPVDNLYYHAPLLLALVGWDALSSRELPICALLGTQAAILFWRLSPLLDPRIFNALYLAVVVPACIAIAITLVRGPSDHRRGTRIAIRAAARTARAG